MTRELPSGTVTLLFTDIEGSTRMLQQLGRETYVRALTEHRRLLREAFTGRGGVEVEMQGDSFFFAFPYAREAVAAAVEAQRALAQHAWEHEPITVRMGLHTGEPMTADGLYAGLDVHRAARIMSAAHGGQILVSQRTADLVEGELATGLALIDLGEHRLKDLAAPQRLHQASAPGLLADFPPPRGSADVPDVPAVLGEGPGRATRPGIGRRTAALAAAAILAVGGAGALLAARATGDPESSGRPTPGTTAPGDDAVSEDFTPLPTATAPAVADPPPARLSADTVVVVDPQGTDVVAEIPVGPDPGRIVADRGEVWVAVGNRTIARIDPARRAMVAAVGTEHDVYDLAPAGGAVWVLSGLPGSAAQVARVEASSAQANVTARVDVGLSRFGGHFSRPALAVGRAGIWVSDPYPPGAIRRIDPTSAEVVRSVTVGGPRRGAGPGLAADERSIWVSVGTARLVRLTASGEVTDSVDISVPPARGAGGLALRDPGGILRLAMGEGALWLITQPASVCCPARTIGTGTLQRIDPVAGAVTGVVPVEGRPIALAVERDAVWVGTRDGTLYRLNPATLAVQKKLSLGHEVGGVAVGAGAVWVTLRSG